MRITQVKCGAVQQIRGELHTKMSDNFSARAEFEFIQKSISQMSPIAAKHFKLKRNPQP